MPRFRYAGLIILALTAGTANAAEGLVAIKSAHDVKETMNRLEKAAKSRGLNVFLRVDHAMGAAKIGKSLRPTELLIFGNPQGGTPPMECAQSAGIDLPLKALAWQDASGQVWLGYNDPQFIVDRHGAKECGPVALKLRKALGGLARDTEWRTMPEGLSGLASRTKSSPPSGKTRRARSIPRPSGWRSNL